MENMIQMMRNKTVLFIFTLLLWTNFIFADDELNPDDPGGGLGQDPGTTAPIHDWIPFVILIMIAIVFYYMHKKKVIVKS